MRYTVKQIQDETYVRKAINDYFVFNSERNLENLLANSLGFALNKYSNLNEINIEFKQLKVGTAQYLNRNILINNLNFTKAQSINDLINLYIALFHELSHAILDNNNCIILSTRQNSELFLGEFSYSHIEDIMNFMCSEEESKGATYFLYYNNPNEIFARRNGLHICKDFFQKFLPEYKNMIPTFSQKTSQDFKIIYNEYPYVKNCGNKYLFLVERYQLYLLNYGLEKLTPNLKENFQHSMVVNFSKQVRNELLDYCIKNKNQELYKDYLSNPYFIPRPDELARLQSVFEKKFVREYSFKKTNGAVNVSKQLALEY